MASIRPILVVEDDSSVLDIASFVLESEGYEVLTATNANEALDALTLHPDVQLVLTDVNMPGDMDGIGLVRELRRQGSDILCVVVSGDAANASQRLDGLVPFLAKPYDRRMLLKAVSDALDAPRSPPR